MQSPRGARQPPVALPSGKPRVSSRASNSHRRHPHVACRSSTSAWPTAKQLARMTFDWMAGRPTHPVRAAIEDIQKPDPQVSLGAHLP